MAVAASLRPRGKRISALKDHSARRNAAAIAIGACQCCGRPRLLRISRSSLSKEKAPPASRRRWGRVAQRRHRQGEPDRNQTEWRRARFRVEQDGGGGASGAMGEARHPSARRRQAELHHRPCWRSPGCSRSREGCVGVWRSRGRRDAAVAVRGDSRIRLPVAARRSAKRGLRLLRAHAGRRPVLLRRPLPDGLPVPTGEAERERAAGISRHREFVAGGLKGAGYVRWKTQIRPGASAPASRRADAERIRSGRRPASPAIPST